MQVCSRRSAALLPVLLALVHPAVGTAAPCWERVIHDWRANGRIDHTYPIECYRSANANLPEDLRQYSTAPEDIQRAMLHAVASGARGPKPPAASGGVTHGTTPLEVAALLAASVGLALVLSALGRMIWTRQRRRRLGSAE